MKIFSWVVCIALAISVRPACAAEFSTIYTFPGGKGAGFPSGPLLLGDHGTLYGTSNGGGRKDFGTVFKLIPPVPPSTEWTEETLYEFRGGAEGGRPFSKVIFDQDTGALLGTTSGQEGGGDQGAVFRLVPPLQTGMPWTLQIIHTFTGGGDGSTPYAGLVQDPASGAVYGATTGGPFDPADFGTVFGFTPDALHQTWTRTLNYAFSGAPGNGAAPNGDLVRSGEGMLYGTTTRGGVVTDACPDGCGTIYSVNPATGILTTLFQSPGNPDPALFGRGTSLLDDASNIYGTSAAGSDANCRMNPGLHCGTAFTMPADGSTAPIVIERFIGKRTGNFNAGLIWNRAHTVLYGATQFGLPNICEYHFGEFGCGAVFKLKHTNGAWKYSLLHAFDGTDGQMPNELAMGKDGTLYGTTAGGGTNSRKYRAGTVFKIENP